MDRYGRGRIRGIDPASVAFRLRAGLQTHQVALAKPPSLKPGSLISAGRKDAAQSTE